MARYSQWKFVSFDSDPAYLGQDYRYADHTDSGYCQFYGFSTFTSVSTVGEKLQEVIRQASQNDLRLEVLFTINSRSAIENLVRQQIGYRFEAVAAKDQFVDKWQDAFLAASKIPPSRLAFRGSYKLKRSSHRFLDLPDLDQASVALVNLLLDTYGDLLPNQSFSVQTDAKLVAWINANDGSRNFNVRDLMLASSALVNMAQSHYIVLFSDPPTFAFTDRVKLFIDAI